MAISTYAELAAELTEALHRNDFTSRISAAVSLTTARFSRELRVPEMESFAYTTTSTEWTALPLDYLEIRSIHAGAEPLEYKTPWELQKIVAAAPARITPCYTISDLSFRIYPTPSNLTVKIVYYQRIAAIQSGTDTNWLLTKYPDAYVEGCMAYLRKVEKDYEGMNIHEQYVTKFLSDMKLKNQTIRTGASPLAVRAA